MGRVKKNTITLEEYEQFLEYPRGQALTSDQLNLMIYMHGFMKIHKRPKRELFDALCTIDLIKPQRSTLKDAFSPNDEASLSLDQVKQDLEALNWQECIVQSIESVSVNDHSQSNGDNFVEFPGSSSKVSRKRQKRKRKRKTKSMADDIGGNSALVAAAAAAAADVEATGYGDLTAACISATQSDSSLYVDTYSWEF